MSKDRWTCCPTKSYVFFDFKGRRLSVDENGGIWGVRRPVKTRMYSLETAPSEIGVKVCIPSKTEGKETLLQLWVAELVAAYWVPNPNNYGYVKHKDGDRRNVKASNLEWVATLNDTYNEQEELFARQRAKLKELNVKLKTYTDELGRMICVNPVDDFLVKKPRGKYLNAPLVRKPVTSKANIFGGYLADPKPVKEVKPKKVKTKIETKPKVKTKVKTKIKIEPLPLHIASKIRKVGEPKVELTKPVVLRPKEPEKVPSMLNPGRRVFGSFGREIKPKRPMYDANFKRIVYDD